MRTALYLPLKTKRLPTAAPTIPNLDHNEEMSFKDDAPPRIVKGKEVLYFT